MAMYKYQLQWCVRGYHIYKEEWEATVGEELKCEREKNNSKDPYASLFQNNLHGFAFGLASLLLNSLHVGALD